MKAILYLMAQRNFITNSHICYMILHIATNQKAAGSIPDGAVGIFRLLIHSGSTMALVSAQPLAEMSNTGISWG